jgi:hypothetical protein
VWFRVNEQLPANLQKSLPDRPPEMQSTDILEGEDIKAVPVSMQLYSSLVSFIKFGF